MIYSERHASSIKLAPSPHPYWTSALIVPTIRQPLLILKCRLSPPIHRYLTYPERRHVFVVLLGVGAC